MSKIVTMPYLFFRGDCREAMEFYKSVFGGKLDIMTNADSNLASEDMPADNIMHCYLSGGDIELMASDTAQASPEAKKISISLNGSDEPRMREIFEALSVDTEVEHPLKKEFWGSTFGSFKDKFGVEWMFDIAMEKNAQQ